MKDCTYSRYAERRIRDYIACPERAQPVEGREPVGEPPNAPCFTRRRREWPRLDRLLSSRSRSQPLRREGAPRCRAARDRQPHARLAADRRSLAAAPPLDRFAAGADRPLLSYRTVRLGGVH